MRRVLVVDDEPHIRTVLRGYLEADGFAVVEAADGETALQAVHAGQPDLVLLDVMLPGIDGLTINRDGREVDSDGTPVPLSTLEFDLLAALADAPGRVFSRRQLLERVWGYDFYGDERVVDVHIRSLRARLGDDALVAVEVVAPHPLEQLTAG